MYISRYGETSKVYKSDIEPLWSDIKPAIDTDYKKTMLTFSKLKTERCLVIINLI